jgi:DNA-directed RNA polymerase beta' subunit
MTINGIYEYLTSKIAKKNGLIQKNLLGKSVDYAVRAVISGPQIDSNRYDEMQVPYGYIGVPLHLTLVLFFPYIIQQLERFFAAYKNNQLVVTTSGDRIEVVNETVNSLSAKSFERMINLYARSPGSRLTPITMYTGEKDKKVKLNLFNDVLGREFTLTDLLYLVASEVVENKYVYATRYPIEDYRNILTAKVKILTTEKTTKQNFSFHTTFLNNNIRLQKTLSRGKIKIFTNV